MKWLFSLAFIFSLAPAYATSPCSQSGINDDMLYKILTPDEWDKFQQDKVFKGSALDVKSGFIHIAFVDQYPPILEKFFKDQRPLILVKVNAKLLKPGTLKIEPNKPGGEKFPHIYGEIPLEAVISHEVLR